MKYLEPYLRAAAWARVWKRAARHYRRGFVFWSNKINNVWTCLSIVDAPDKHPDGDGSTTGRIRGLAWQRDHAVDLAVEALQKYGVHQIHCTRWRDVECTCGLEDIKNQLKGLRPV